MDNRAGRGPSSPVQTVLDLGGLGVAGALAMAAKLRGGKAVHPQGMAYSATLTIDGAGNAPEGSALLSTPAEWRAVVRISRSLGLPRPIPDLLGMAIRVLDAYGADSHQDFMLVTSVDAPVLHHVFLPAADAQQRSYSSSLPYRAGDRTFLIGTRPDPASPRPEGADEIDRMTKAAQTGRLQFELVVAPLWGRFERVGALRIESELPDLDALRFNPLNTGGGLEPRGTLNRWREFAYPLSQRAWGSATDKGEAQRRADAEVGALRAGSPHV